MATVVGDFVRGSGAHTGTYLAIPTHTPYVWTYIRTHVHVRVVRLFRLFITKEKG